MIVERTRRITLAFFAVYCLMSSAARADAQSNPKPSRLYDLYQSTSTSYPQKLLLWRMLHSRDPKRTLTPPAPPVYSVVASTEPRPVVAVISRKNGGKATRPDGAAVMIPARALSRDSFVTISSAAFHSSAEEAAKAASMAAQNLRGAGAAVAFGPDGLAFSSPATITLPYDRGAVRSAGLSVAGLRVYGWSAANLAWRPLPTIAHAAAHTVSARTTRFSLYRVMGLPAAKGGTKRSATPTP